MKNHPFYYALRLVLEMATFSIIATWASVHHQGVWHWVAIILYPCVAAAVWVVFIADRESGKVLVKVNGLTRLLVEILFFGITLRMLNDLESGKLYTLFWVLLLIQYAISYDRIKKLFADRKSN